MEDLHIFTGLEMPRKNMLDSKAKQRIINRFKTHATDTGSSEVQIAILSEEIKRLTEHLKEHKKDFSSRKGLIKKVNERRKLLKYLLKENQESYENIIKKLKIKPITVISAVEEPEESDLIASDNEEEQEETQE